MILRVAIVGCGAIADSHVEEIKKLPGVELVSVCDLELIMAEQIAERYRVAHTYDDVDRMLGEQSPHVVHITTPPQSHVELARKAIDAGCHVFVEKPVALTAGDTRDLIEYARRRQRKLCVGHIYQFDPPALAVRRMVAAGIVGDVTHIDSHFGYNLAGSFGRGILGNSSHWVHGLPGNILQNNLSHPLAKAVEFMAGDEPRVLATATRGDGSFGDIRDRMYRELRAILVGDSVTANVTFTTSARPIAHSLRVFGTRNTVHANFVTRTVTLERAPALPSALGRLLAAFPQGWEHHREGWKNVFRFLKYDFHFQMGMNELFRRFYRSIHDDTEPPVSYADIMTIAYVMDDIFAQTADTDGADR